MLWIVAKTSKKAKKKTPAQLKTKLWELCKKITRERYQNANGTWNCFTCGRLIDEPAKAQTGHFIPSGACGAYLRYDLRNLRIQDYYCNINLGGNGSAFYLALLNEMGEDFLADLFRDKNRVIKADALFYQSKIDEYQAL